MLVFDKNNGTSLDIGNADIPEGYTDIPVPLEIQGQNVQFSGGEWVSMSKKLVHEVHMSRMTRIMPVAEFKLRMTSAERSAIKKHEIAGEVMELLAEMSTVDTGAPFMVEFFEALVADKVITEERRISLEA